MRMYSESGFHDAKNFFKSGAGFQLAHPCLRLVQDHMYYRSIQTIVAQLKLKDGITFLAPKPKSEMTPLKPFLDRKLVRAYQPTAVPSDYGRVSTFEADARTELPSTAHLDYRSTYFTNMDVEINVP